MGWKGRGEDGGGRVTRSEAHRRKATQQRAQTAQANTGGRGPSTRSQQHARNVVCVDRLNVQRRGVVLPLCGDASWKEGRAAPRSAAVGHCQHCCARHQSQLQHPQLRLSTQHHTRPHLHPVAITPGDEHGQLYSSTLHCTAQPILHRCSSSQLRRTAAAASSQPSLHPPALRRALITSVLPPSVRARCRSAPLWESDGSWLQNTLHGASLAAARAVDTSGSIQSHTPCRTSPPSIHVVCRCSC